MLNIKTIILEIQISSSPILYFRDFLTYFLWVARWFYHWIIKNCDYTRMLAVWKLARQHSHINSEVSVHQSHSLTVSLRALPGSHGRHHQPRRQHNTPLSSHTPGRRVRCESDNYWGDIVSVNWGRTVKAGVRRVMWWADNQEAICIHIPGTAARQLCWALPSSSICYLGSKVTTQYLD